MSSIIAGTIKCVGIPLTLLSLLSLRKQSKLTKDKVCLLLIVFFGFLWRIVYFRKTLFSSRYCLLFILFAVVLTVFFLVEETIMRSIVVVSAVFLYQLYDTYDDYKKMYINDVKEILSVIDEDDQSNIIIRVDELLRIGNTLKHYESMNKYINGVEKIYELETYYDFRGCRLYVAFYDKRNEYQNLIPYSKVVFNSKTGKTNKNFFTVIVIDTLKKDINPFSPDTAKNQLINGHFEEIEDRELSISKLSKWIDADCDFYKNDSLILPKHHRLLSYWEIPPKDNYPKVCISSEKPIEGIYSLFVEFQDNNVLYLMNVINTKSGWLSFTIQSLDSKSHLTLNEYTYSRDLDFIDNYHLKDLILLDNKNHQISIMVPERSKNEHTSVFVLSGSNTSFKIDDLSYCYHQED